jgi:methyltransferase
MTGAAILLAAVTAERLAELALARANTRALLAKGGREVAAGHYPLIVALHAAWLAALWLQGWDAPLQLGWLAIFLVLQAGRGWVLATLGRRWTTRIIVVPGEDLVRRGPFRLLPHPNYAVVVGEIATLPLALGLPWTALAFSLLNALVLAIRIPAENRALAGASGPPA